MSTLFELVQILAVNLANSGNINMVSFDRDIRNGARLYRDMGDDYRARMYDICADNIAKMVRIKSASEKKG